jgi:hypothetical protein
MLCRFVSTHSKVAEQQVIRIFVTAPIHFGCDCVDAFPVQIEGPEQTVDKWNNFAFRLCLASAIVKVSGVQERQCSRLAQHAVGIASRYRLD